MSTLPRTSVDTFTHYEWQMSSAIRPLYKIRYGLPHKVYLYRVCFIGRRCLAEPVRGKKYGPPYTVQTMPANGPGSQREVCLAFRRDAAASAVRRYDKHTFNEEQQLPFEQVA